MVLFINGFLLYFRDFRHEIENLKNEHMFRMDVFNIRIYLHIYTNLVNYVFSIFSLLQYFMHNIKRCRTANLIENANDELLGDISI